ncbi:MAG: site-2 protease family protein [Christensenellaceae bacterium]|jgi:stage IV sporulation protein FB|nr:site-2 protease family protein [Christensenellaceae bacterium]
MKFFVHPLFIVVIVASFVAGAGQIICAMLFAVILHELAHAAAARRYNLYVERLAILPFGCALNIDCSFLSRDKKIAVLLAGPLANAVAIILFSSVLWFAPSLFSGVEFMIYANLFPAVLNLLPIYGFDGGKILNELFSERKGFEKGLKFFSLGIIGAMILIFIFLNYSISIFLTFLFLSILIDSKKPNFIPAFNKNKNSQVREFVINEAYTLFEIYKLIPNNFNAKFILDDIILYERDIENFLGTHAADTKIKMLI